MGRKCKLNDLEQIKSVVLEYKKDTKPSLVDLCDKLKVTPPTFYAAMEKDDEIAECLIEAWNHLVKCWEKKLWESSPTAAIFYLKTIRRFGFEWRDTPPPEKFEVVNDNDDGNKLIIEVVTKNAKTETIPTTA